MGVRLADKIAIVTGAGTSGEGMGNGKAAALLFAREGATIVAVDLITEAAKLTADAIQAEGGRALRREENPLQCTSTWHDGHPAHSNLLP